jgi:hypothetical protein
MTENETDTEPRWRTVVDVVGWLLTLAFIAYLGTIEFPHLAEWVRDDVLLPVANFIVTVWTVVAQFWAGLL